jgi:hypothetical protein
VRPHVRRRPDQTQALDADGNDRGNDDATQRQARRCHGKRQRPAHVEPTRQHRSDRHQSAAAVRKAEDNMEQEKLPCFVEQADRAQHDRADAGVDGNDDAGVDAIDEAPGDGTTDAAGQKKCRRGAGRQRDRKAPFADEGREQDREIVKGKAGCRRRNERDRRYHIPAVKDWAARRRLGWRERGNGVMLLQRGARGQVGGGWQGECQRGAGC